MYNAVGQMIAEYVAGASVIGGLKYVTADHLGSTRVVSGAGGLVLVRARYDYLPFGEAVGATIGARTTATGYSRSDPLRQKFTGKERDNETGLDFAEARYFSSAQGRFTSVDSAPGIPINPQSWNRYSYCVNSPLKYINPNGLIGCKEKLNTKGQRLKGEQTQQAPLAWPVPQAVFVPLSL